MKLRRTIAATAILASTLLAAQPAEAGVSHRMGTYFSDINYGGLTHDGAYITDWTGRCTATHSYEYELVPLSWRTDGGRGIRSINLDGNPAGSYCNFVELFGAGGEEPSFCKSGFLPMPMTCGGVNAPVVWISWEYRVRPGRVM